MLSSKIFFYFIFWPTGTARKNKTPPSLPEMSPLAIALGPGGDIFGSVKYYRFRGHLIF
jgi:hypothetical protein